MRLWRKRDSDEGSETEAAAAVPADPAGAAGDMAPADEAGPVDEPAPIGGPAPFEEPAPGGEASPADAPVPGGDPALPGTAGYRHRKPGDTMPARFTFVRPDGQPEPKKRRGWLRG